MSLEYNWLHQKHSSNRQLSLTFCILFSILSKHLEYLSFHIAHQMLAVTILHLSLLLLDCIRQKTFFCFCLICWWTSEELVTPTSYKLVGHQGQNLSKSVSHFWVISTLLALFHYIPSIFQFCSFNIPLVLLTWKMSFLVSLSVLGEFSYYFSIFSAR